MFVSELVVVYCSLVTGLLLVFGLLVIIEKLLKCHSKLLLKDPRHLAQNPSMLNDSFLRRRKLDFMNLSPRGWGLK